MSNITLKPGYSTRLFTDIYESVNDFVYDYNNIGIPKIISVDNVTTLYYLLYARYGNSPIANYDENQFKYKVFSIIWQYGPTWEKRLSVQTTLRSLSEEDLLKGAISIYNHAYNPETAPSTVDTDQLNYVNDQNVSKHTKNKLAAYSELLSLLETDVTGEFLNRFSICFKKFARPGTYLYVTEEEDEDDV